MSPLRLLYYQKDSGQPLFTGIEELIDQIVLIPDVPLQTLAEMIGTTRSRVSFFMNRFRKLGFINYDVGETLHVHSSLLNIVLHDDNGIGTPKAASPAVSARKALEPPAKPGGPLEKDRARRPPLSLKRTQRERLSKS